jgi:hypothetical protein
MEVFKTLFIMADEKKLLARGDLMRSCSLSQNNP